jgi:hypothetical protein
MTKLIEKKRSYSLVLVEFAKAHVSVLICRLFEILKQSNITVTSVQAVRLLHYRMDLKDKSG